MKWKVPSLVFTKIHLVFNLEASPCQLHLQHWGLHEFQLGSKSVTYGKCPIIFALGTQQVCTSDWGACPSYLEWPGIPFPLTYANSCFPEKPIPTIMHELLGLLVFPFVYAVIHFQPGEYRQLKNVNDCWIYLRLIYENNFYCIKIIATKAVKKGGTGNLVLQSCSSRISNFPLPGLDLLGSSQGCLTAEPPITNTRLPMKLTPAAMRKAVCHWLTFVYGEEKFMRINQYQCGTPVSF